MGKDTLFDRMKKGISKISDELNRDKWDPGCVNLALFDDDDPNKPVPPKKPEEDTGRMDFQSQLNLRNQNQAAMAGGNVALAPAPDMDTSGRPRVKGLNSEKATETVSEKPKKDMPEYVQPVFKSRFTGPTPPGANNAKKDGLVSLADLPKVDPSQSISNIAPPPPLTESIPPVQETSMGSHTLLKTHISKKVSVARPVTSKTVLPSAQTSEAFVPNVNKPAPSSSPIPAPMPAVAAVAAAGYVTVSAAGITSPAPISIPEAPIPAPVVAASVIPGVIPEAPVKAPIEAPAATVTPTATDVVTPIVSNTVSTPMPEAERIPVFAAESAKSNAKFDKPVTESAPVDKPEEVSEAEDEEIDRCYYVFIKHTSTYPAKGSQVIMRSCDHNYVWTDEQDESEKPKFDKCPGCGKPLGWTDVEME